MSRRSAYPDAMGDNKYWDYRECGWVPYDAASEAPVVPAQLMADDVDADEVTAVETPL